MRAGLVESLRKNDGPKKRRASNLRQPARQFLSTTTKARMAAFPERTVETLREQAARCRRLAGGMTDFEVRCRLLDLAVEFDERADELGAATAERCADSS